MKYDICVFGGCSIDAFYYQKEDMTFGETADKFEAGGKGANQAVASARAGAKVVMLSRLGNDELGQKIKQNLLDNNVDTQFIEMVDGLNNDFSKIYVTKIDGANDIVRFNGAIDSFYPEMVEKYKHIILNSKFVVAQMKAPKEFSIALINFCYDNGVPIVVTPCRPSKLVLTDDLNKELIDKITYLTMNAEECKTIFNSDNIAECVEKYPKKIIVTSGLKGVFYHDGQKMKNIPANKSIIAIDSTGAGDTFCGNFVASLVKGKSFEESLNFAQCSSQIQIQHKGAQSGMPYFKDVLQYQKEQTKNHIPCMQ